MRQMSANLGKMSIVVSIISKGELHREHRMDSQRRRQSGHQVVVLASITRERRIVPQSKQGWPDLP